MQKQQAELSVLIPPNSAKGLSKSHRARSVGIGRAHAKAILLGEHAVVYGAPALALPIPQLTATASVGWSPHSPDGPHDMSLTMTGSASRPMVTQASESLRRLTAEFRASMGVTDRLHLDMVIDCAIPPGRGLGSSAACARAVVLALADLFDRKISQSTAFDLVQTAENVTHGRASGVDAMAVGASVPLLFQAGEAQELAVGCEGLFIIADSGVVGRTRDAVELLREGFLRHPGSQERFVLRASVLTEEARHAFADGRPEELGSRLTEYHELLRTAGLSIDRIDTLVEAARTAGALGAKMTGGGMGGCMIALTRSWQASEVTRKLHEAGAVQTWVLPLRRLASHAP
ncbi:mevalonate kinase [Streptomyces anulatus]|uniref:mevalonate kinase n=1 Tax=Streptomyces anulatus TaxID=1892 RepID=A0A7K3R600_STRAQ|nr:mevalonate kinase [Streptomyces anulatus]NED24003.1 mevalonate kinase [Streptomyces anulatus]